MNESITRFAPASCPYLHATNGVHLSFRDARDELNPSRTVSRFHTPRALEEHLARDFDRECQRFGDNPNENPRLRDYQQRANTAVETAIGQRVRAILVAMATGSGKTFTTVNQIYRLLKSGVARRVLFLVDRWALAAQAVRAFAAFEPEPNQKFDRLYEVYSQRFRREDLGDDAFDPKKMRGNYLVDPGAGHTLVYICTSLATSGEQAGVDGNRTHLTDETPVTPVLKTGAVTRAAYTPEKGVGSVSLSPEVAKGRPALSFSCKRIVVVFVRRPPAVRVGWSGVSPAVATICPVSAAFFASWLASENYFRSWLFVGPGRIHSLRSRRGRTRRWDRRNGVGLIGQAEVRVGVGGRRMLSPSLYVTTTCERSCGRRPSCTTCDGCLPFGNAFADEAERAGAVAAILCRCDGPPAMHRWAVERCDLLSRFLPLPNGIPSRDCLRRLLLLNEITAVPELLEQLQLDGAVVTIDAMGCQRAIVEQTVAQKGDFVIAVKDNQPKLRAAIEEFFNERIDRDFQDLDYRRHDACDEGHGRTDGRACYPTDVPLNSATFYV